MFDHECDVKPSDLVNLKMYVHRHVDIQEERLNTNSQSIANLTSTVRKLMEALGYEEVSIPPQHLVRKKGAKGE